ncbi:MAG TPA: inverse autotransporter beta domain-containing protein [Alphaproteobacteria bacterium]|nr:inverse autotransporter beta domain-containing protein [Alphaproteobacteria bacterium]
MKKSHLFLFLFLIISTIAAFKVINSEVDRSTPKWTPESRLNLKVGTQRSIGQIGILSPIAQNETALFFMDTRFMRDSKRDMEGNYGFGYRTLDLTPGWISGFYGFFDQRYTRYNHTLNQVTFGGELLSETWDYRLNTYWALSGPRTIHSLTKLTYQGHDRYLTQSQEIPLSGFDAEIGRAIPNFEDLRVYGAFYRFQGKSQKNMNGARLRGAYEINKYVSLNAEIQHDNIRNSSSFIGISFKVPIGEVDETKKLSKLERRMTDEIVRDVDIVTSSQEVRKKIAENLIHLHPEGKLPADGGDGSYESPFPLYNDNDAPPFIKDYLDLDANSQYKWFVIGDTMHPIRRKAPLEILEDHLIGENLLDDPEIELHGIFGPPQNLPEEQPFVHDALAVDVLPPEENLGDVDMGPFEAEPPAAVEVQEQHLIFNEYPQVDAFLPRENPRIVGIQPVDVFVPPALGLPEQHSVFDEYPLVEAFLPQDNPRIVGIQPVGAFVPPADVNVVEIGPVEGPNDEDYLPMTEISGDENAKINRNISLHQNKRKKKKSPKVYYRANRKKAPQSQRPYGAKVYYPVHSHQSSLNVSRAESPSAPTAPIKRDLPSSPTLMSPINLSILNNPITPLTSSSNPESPGSRFYADFHKRLRDSRKINFAEIKKIIRRQEKYRDLDKRKRYKTPLNTIQTRGGFRSKQETPYRLRAPSTREIFSSQPIKHDNSFRELPRTAAAYEISHSGEDEGATSSLELSSFHLQPSFPHFPKLVESRSISSPFSLDAEPDSILSHSTSPTFDKREVLVLPSMVKADGIKELNTNSERASVASQSRARSPKLETLDRSPSSESEEMPAFSPLVMSSPPPLIPLEFSGLSSQLRLNLSPSAALPSTGPNSQLLDGHERLSLSRTPGKVSNAQNAADSVASEDHVAQPVVSSSPHSELALTDGQESPDISSTVTIRAPLLPISAVSVSSSPPKNQPSAPSSPARASAAMPHGEVPRVPPPSSQTSQSLVVSRDPQTPSPGRKKDPGSLRGGANVRPGSNPPSTQASPARIPLGLKQIQLGRPLDKGENDTTIESSLLNCLPDFENMSPDTILVNNAALGSSFPLVESIPRSKLSSIETQHLRPNTLELFFNQMGVLNSSGSVQNSDQNKGNEFEAKMAPSYPSLEGRPSQSSSPKRAPVAVSDVRHPASPELGASENSFLSENQAEAVVRQHSVGDPSSPSQVVASSLPSISLSSKMRATTAVTPNTNDRQAKMPSPTFLSDSSSVQPLAALLSPSSLNPVQSPSTQRVYSDNQGQNEDSELSTITEIGSSPSSSSLREDQSQRGSPETAPVTISAVQHHASPELGASENSFLSENQAEAVVRQHSVGDPSSPSQVVASSLPSISLSSKMRATTAVTPNTNDRQAKMPSPTFLSDSSSVQPLAALLSPSSLNPVQSPSTQRVDADNQDQNEDSLLLSITNHQEKGHSFGTNFSGARYPVENPPAKVFNLKSRSVSAAPFGSVLGERRDNLDDHRETVRFRSHSSASTLDSPILTPHAKKFTPLKSLGFNQSSLNKDLLESSHASLSQPFPSLGLRDQSAASLSSVDRTSSDRDSLLPSFNAPLAAPGSASPKLVETLSRPPRDNSPLPLPSENAPDLSAARDLSSPIPLSPSSLELVPSPLIPTVAVSQRKGEDADYSGADYSGADFPRGNRPLRVYNRNLRSAPLHLALSESSNSLVRPRSHSSASTLDRPLPLDLRDQSVPSLIPVERTSSERVDLVLPSLVGGSLVAPSNEHSIRLLGPIHSSKPLLPGHEPSSRPELDEDLVVPTPTPTPPPHSSYREESFSGSNVSHPPIPVSQDNDLSNMASSPSTSLISSSAAPLVHQEGRGPSLEGDQPRSSSVILPAQKPLTSRRSELLSKLANTRQTLLDNLPDRASSSPVKDLSSPSLGISSLDQRRPLERTGTARAAASLTEIDLESPVSPLVAEHPVSKLEDLKVQRAESTPLPDSKKPNGLSGLLLRVRSLFLRSPTTQRPLIGIEAFSHSSENTKNPLGVVKQQQYPLTGPEAFSHRGTQIPTTGKAKNISGVQQTALTGPGAFSSTGVSFQ